MKKDVQVDQNVLSGSEKERNCNKEEEEEEAGHMNLPPNPNIVYMKTTKDKEKGVKITTSVSVSDMKDSVPKITFQLSDELLSEHLSNSSTALSEFLKSKGFGLKLKLEMMERTDPNRSPVESEVQFTYGDDCKEPPPTAESLERPSEHAWCSREAHTTGQTQEDAHLPTSQMKDSPSVSQSFSEQGFGSGGHGPAPSAEHHRPHLRSTALDGLAFSALHHFHPASINEAGDVFSAAPRLSVCDRRGCALQRPQGNINCPKRKSWNQNMGAEQRGFPMKRCHTFPGMSEPLGMMQEELVLPYQGCVWSLIMNSVPLNTVRLGNIHQEKICHSSFGSRRPQRPPSMWSSNSVPQSQQAMKICRLNPCGRQTISRYLHGNVKLGQEGRQGNHSEEADGWFYQELEGEDPGPDQLAEKLRDMQILYQPVKTGEHQDGASVLPQPVSTEHPHRFPPATLALPDEWSEDKKHLQMDTENREEEPKQESERSSSPSAALSADKQEKRTKMDKLSHQSTSRCMLDSYPARIHFKRSTDSRWKPFPVPTDTSQRLRPADGGVSDHWAVKRKLFKENRQWSSAGGSSITSDMMDEQGWSKQPEQTQVCFKSRT